MKYAKIDGLVILSIVVLAIHPILAHSWIERIMNIAPNGTFMGAPGYPRGYVSRYALGYVDSYMLNQVPPDDPSRPAPANIFPTDLMCKDTQVLGNQTAGAPKLSSYPGARIALQYQENGHVTEPDNVPGKPTNRGTVFVYATQESRSNDTLLSIHGQWNANGTGGDGRGMLIATRNFDDGQCYQINDQQISISRQAEFPHTADPLMGADLWCQADVQLPANLILSKDLTLYWLWDWPTAAGTPGEEAGKQQMYTTCMDIALNDTELESPSTEAVNFVDGQSLNSAAIAEQLMDQFIATGTLTASSYGLVFNTVAMTASVESISASVTTATPMLATSTTHYQSEDMISTVTTTTTVESISTIPYTTTITLASASSISEQPDVTSSNTLSDIPGFFLHHRSPSRRITRLHRY